MANKYIDEATGVETTGHVWDGVTELNNPMPRWWVTLFYATIVFGIGYTIFYPAWPMLTTATQGVLGYSTRAEVARDIAAHAGMQSAWRDRIAAASVEEIRADPELFQFAMAAGAANFAVNCSQCHGAGAAGNPGGYPNLNDDAWLWGGSLEAIYATVTHGVRNETDPDARFSMMTAFGADGLLDKAQIGDVAQHVLSLSGRASDPASAERGAAVFAENCAACHGENGAGNPDLGAPNLSDGIWLYGDTAQAVEAQVWRPKHGVMPAWGQRLGDTAVKELAVYVHALGGGQ